MTFEIYLINGNNRELIHFEGDSTLIVYDAELEQSAGQAGVLKFNVPPVHPFYDAFHVKQSLIEVLRDGAEYFRGEVRNTDTDFDKVLNVEVVEDIAFLGEYIISPRYSETTYTSAFSQILTEYNANMPTVKQFEIGYIYNANDTELNLRVDYGMSALDVIKQKICTAYGYIRVRRTAGHRYIDVVPIAYYGKLSDQHIEVGENLLDYEAELITDNLVTRVYPYGAKVDSYVAGDIEARVNITSVNDGIEYVVDDTAEAVFGRIDTVLLYDDIDSPATLKSKAENYLEEHTAPQLKLSLDVIDMSTLSLNYQTLELGDGVIIEADYFNLNTMLYIINKTTSLTDASRNKITLSTTQTTHSLTQELNNATNDIAVKLPSKSSILQEAQRNAQAFLEGATGGYVVYDIDANNTIKAIMITNSLNPANATKKWVWNENGLGYMHIVNGSWVTEVAMTIDGSIVADRITSGYMYADRIKGGTLSLGGVNDVNGKIDVVDASNNQIMRINNNGIYRWAYNTSLVSNILRSWWNKDRLTFFKDINTGYYPLSEFGKEGCLFYDGTHTLDDINGASTRKSLAIGAFDADGLLAKKGYIGNGSAGWAIGDNNLHNGCTSITSNSSGTYLGVDGIRNIASNGRKATIRNGNIQLDDNGGNECYIRFNDEDANYHLGFSSHNSSARNNGAYYQCESWKIISMANSSSDIRLKEHIQELDTVTALAVLRASKTYSFNFKNAPSIKRFGVLAQELKAGIDRDTNIDTEHLWLINKNSFDDMYCVQYEELVPFLINVTVNQEDKIEELEAKVETLESRIARLESLVQELSYKAL